MLIIFIIINFFQKDRNLTFFVIYYYKINIFPSTWDHKMQNFINIHAIIEKKCSIYFYKN